MAAPPSPPSLEHVWAVRAAVRVAVRAAVRAGRHDPATIFIDTIRVDSAVPEPVSIS